MGFQAQNPFTQFPFLQYLLSGANVGQGANAGANPFFNLYSPAPPGTSQTTTFPSPIAGPGASPPPILPPPSSATIAPTPTAAGASPIGQIPPLPAGAVAAGQGQQGLPIMPTGPSPAAVPPFMATTPQAPSMLAPGQPTPAPTGSSGTGGQQPASAPGATWMWSPGFGGGQFTINGRAGVPAIGDMIQVPGGPLMSYSQFTTAYGVPGGRSPGPQGNIASQL